LSLPRLRQLSETTREGSNLLTLSEAAESIGFRTLGVKISLEKLLEAPLPCILHWNNNHNVVLFKITNYELSKKQQSNTQHPTPNPISHQPALAIKQFLLGGF